VDPDHTTGEMEPMHAGFVVMYAVAFGLYCWLGATQERER
jgi:hypothetical protein